MGNLFLGFISKVGEDNDGFYHYEFIFTDNPDEFWGEDFEEMPVCLNKDLRPADIYITEVHRIKTKIKLSLIQNNCCFSFQDAADDIVALGFEDIGDYDVYPDDGRLVFFFRDTYEEVEEMLAKKNIIML